MISMLLIAFGESFGIKLCESIIEALKILVGGTDEVYSSVYVKIPIFSRLKDLLIG